MCRQLKTKIHPFNKKYEHFDNKPNFFCDKGQSVQPRVVIVSERCFAHFHCINNAILPKVGVRRHAELTTGDDTNALRQHITLHPRIEPPHSLPLSLFFPLSLSFLLIKSTTRSYATYVNFLTRTKLFWCAPLLFQITWKGGTCQYHVLLFQYFQTVQKIHLKLFSYTEMQIL